MIKAALTLSFAILFASLGDILFSRGMQARGEVEVCSIWDLPLIIKSVFTNPLILTGMLSMGLHLCSYISALAWVDVSVANPMTSLSYVLVTAYVVFIAKEHINKPRWAGVVLITLGAILVGFSS